jgi:hypothetical protein
MEKYVLRTIDEIRILPLVRFEPVVRELNHVPGSHLEHVGAVGVVHAVPPAPLTLGPVHRVRGKVIHPQECRLARVFGAPDIVVRGSFVTCQKLGIGRDGCPSLTGLTECNGEAPAIRRCVQYARK